jgi:predicted dehydrogenase
VKQGNVTTFAFDKPEPLRVEHENFRDKLLGKDSDIATLREGIETVRVADAVIQSSKLGQSIEL